MDNKTTNNVFSISNILKYKFIKELIILNSKQITIRW